MQTPVRKVLQVAVLFVLGSSAYGAGDTELPFHRGVNLTNWFQASGPRQIQFTRFTRQDLANIQGLGCDVIRLPINLHAMTGGPPAYTLDTLFLEFLDQVVDWAEGLQIHLILDNHSFDPASDTDPNIGEILVRVWTQMARHYRDRSRYLIYEVLNEPHGIEDVLWNAIQQQVVEAIRSVDSRHTIIIGPAGWNSYNNLKYMPEIKDPNLIYTFHFYDPFLFTHQGASWSSPSMVSLAGVPFPYDPHAMPACPNDLIGSWVEGALNVSYKTEGTAARVRQLLDRAVSFQAQRRWTARLFCGEFGVYMPNSDPAQRVAWYRLVREALEERGIAWTTWDYTGGFGLFEAGGNDLFEHDLNGPLVAALDFNCPAQTDYVLEPDSAGFALYTDYVAPHCVASSSVGDGTLDYYHGAGPAQGKYCIHWTGSGQYHQVGFNFTPDKDLSVLVRQGYAVELWARGDSPGSRLDLRFVDTKTGPDDHPWRIRVRLDQARSAWDGAWHRVRIPLADFTEHGSWDNGWFNPQGRFDWTAVDRFEIASEYHSLDGMQFWFDQIQVAGP